MRIKNHTETVISKPFSLSIFALCFLSIILFWHKIILLIDCKWSFPLKSKSRERSVKKFCDRFKVITPARWGRIFWMVSSLSLFLINLTVFALEPLISSQIWIIAASPNYAFVKSTVYSWSLTSPSSIFSYFSVTFIFEANFFRFGFSRIKDISSFLFDLYVSCGLFIFICSYFFWKSWNSVIID